MQLLIGPEITDPCSRPARLGGLFSHPLTAETVWDRLLEKQFRQNWGPIRLAACPPKADAALWPPRIKSAVFDPNHITATDGDYLLVHNSQWITDIPSRVFREIAAQANADVIAVCAAPRLRVFCETPRITEQAGLVGISRPSADSMEPAPAMTDWPHHLLIRRDRCVLSMLGSEPIRFQDWLAMVAGAAPKVLYLDVAGSALDLGSEPGLLSLFDNPDGQEDSFDHPIKLSPSVRVFGNPLCSADAQIDDEAVLACPAVICSRAKIGAGAVIQNSIIGPDLVIPAGAVIQNRVLWTQAEADQALGSDCRSHRPLSPVSAPPSFRQWPWWSYIHLGKRIIDILFSLAVLIVCLPIFVIVFAVIQATCPGPVFYRARRQGRYGIEFDCLKFRTMILKADALQDRLRAVNQVDGPQFKMDDDPRITGVGKFLRNTCIDEIPQFINVLLGQMSVIGPRPSPEEENRNCPPWRDARLSVRPGITGLWQICRTRRPGMDFQEWVYYDTEYVRKVSLRLDLIICIRTILHLVKQFLAQFG